LGSAPPSDKQFSFHPEAAAGQAGIIENNEISAIPTAGLLFYRSLTKRAQADVIAEFMVTLKDPAPPIPPDCAGSFCGGWPMSGSRSHTAPPARVLLWPV
jgi:hypothetical protein